MVQLKKGQNVKLTKGVTNVKVGLSWDASLPGDDDMDLDVMAIELTEKNGQALGDDYLVFYNSAKKTKDGKPTDPQGAIIHSGDNRTGNGDGDDEVMTVDFSKLDSRVNAILFIVNIYDEDHKGYNFGQVRNPRARLYYNDNSVADIVYELDEDYSVEKCLEFCMLYKHNNEWKFQAVGTANSNGLLEEIRKYGIPAEGNV